MNTTIIFIALLTISTLLLAMTIWNGLLTFSIKKHSKLYNELIKLNVKYKPLFTLMAKSRYDIDYSCRSLQMYKNHNNMDSIMNYLTGYMREQGLFWLDLYEKTQTNSKNLKNYHNEYELLKKTYSGANNLEGKRTLPLSEKRYKAKEDKVCCKNQLKPVTTIDIVCVIHYTSPKGKNSYSSTWETDLGSVISRIQKQSEAEQSIEYQRSLMTSSKRYEILRRDNYRCLICGRTANDGAKLEVDHIVPVSKGGKTTDSNLQTLCRDCNQGKGAKP